MDEVNFENMLASGNHGKRCQQEMLLKALSIVKPHAQPQPTHDLTNIHAFCRACLHVLASMPTRNGKHDLMTLQICPRVLPCSPPRPCKYAHAQRQARPHVLTNMPTRFAALASTSLQVCPRATASTTSCPYKYAHALRHACLHVLEHMPTHSRKLKAVPLDHVPITFMFCKSSYCKY